MGNLVYILLYSYKGLEKTIKDKEIKIYPKWIVIIFFLLLIINFIGSLYYLFKKGNVEFNLLIKFFSTTYTLIFICVWYLEKINIKRYKDNAKNYYKRINVFEKILKNEFNLYSKQKILLIIKQCEDEIKALENPKEHTEKFISISSKIIYPIFAVIISIFLISKNPVIELSSDDIVTLMILISTSFVFVNLLLYLLLYIPYFSNRYTISNIKELYRLLNDIYILDFSDLD